MLMQLNIVRMDLGIQHFKKTLGATLFNDAFQTHAETKKIFFFL